MIYGMDQDYAKCCKNYIHQWIKERNAQHFEMTDDVVEYIIIKGGDGLRELEACFHKIVDVAEEYEIEFIDKSFIDKVFS